MLHLTRTHGFYSIFTQHTAKQQRSLAHTVSLDEIQHVHPLPLITIISLFWQLIDRSVQCVLCRVSAATFSSIDFSNLIDIFN